MLRRRARRQRRQLAPLGQGPGSGPVHRLSLRQLHVPEHNEGEQPPLRVPAPQRPHRPLPPPPQALRRKEAAAAAAPPGRQARCAARQTNLFIAQALEQVARAEEAHARAVGFLSLARQAHLFAALPLLQADVVAKEQGVARAKAEVAALMRELAGRRVAAVAAWRGKAAVLRRAVTRAMAAFAAKEPRSWALGKGDV